MGRVHEVESISGDDKIGGETGWDGPWPPWDLDPRISAMWVSKREAQFGIMSF